MKAGKWGGRAARGPEPDDSNDGVDDRRALRVLKTWIVFALLAIAIIVAMTQLMKTDINQDEPTIEDQ